MNSRRFKTQLAGLVGLVMIGLVVVALVGMYQKSFTKTVDITVESDRAGLQLDKGARVRAFGVPVGEVRKVQVAATGVRISVALDTKWAGQIPRGVTASIKATTVFGAKFVDLEVPRGRVVNAIQDNEVIQSDRTAIEANDVFAHAMSLLDAIQPEKLNTALSGAVDALNGRGEKLGRLITSTDQYLTALNPHLDALQKDFDGTATVARDYNSVAPDGLDAIDQFTTTSDLLNETKRPLADLLQALVPASDSVTAGIKSFDKPLTSATEQLLPVSALLNTYAPGLPCTLGLLIQHTKVLPESLNKAHPVIETDSGFLPGQDPYTVAENLPKLVTGVGPKCYKRATLDDPNPPHIQFDDGLKNIYTNGSLAPKVNNPVSLYEGTVKSFIGDSGLAALQKSLAPTPQGGGQ